MHGWQQVLASVKGLARPRPRWYDWHEGISIKCIGVSGTARPAVPPMQMNFVCGTRNDTGGPRCVVCPQICSSACGAGYACDRDPADGSVQSLLLEAAKRDGRCHRGLRA